MLCVWYVLKFEYLHIIRLHIIIIIICSIGCPQYNNTHTHTQPLFIFAGNPSPNITWTKKFENLPNGKIVLRLLLPFLPPPIIIFHTIKEINRYFVQIKILLLALEWKNIMQMRREEVDPKSFPSKHHISIFHFSSVFFFLSHNAQFK